MLIKCVTVLAVNYYRQIIKDKEEPEAKEPERALNVDNWDELREKEDFYVLWVHQIKTPIAALNLLLQDPDKNEALCRQELFKIENYVEMSLNYLRFESMSNDLGLKSYNLESMVKQVVKKYSSVFIYNHIAVNMEDLDCDILTDEKWFCFVLEQILSNALKYTKKGSVTFYAEQDGNNVKLKVKDTGIGIRSEDIPRLFQKGFTGYNGRIDKKASGLGLYLCKSICDKLGHAISITSEEGVGTEVCITVAREKVKTSDLTKM
ncbi:MAG: sensor histidine kinase [Butyrivibrio sp.]|nr:sensor histidine kinase [Butyrivibrio sp.]